MVGRSQNRHRGYCLQLAFDPEVMDGSQQVRSAFDPGNLIELPCFFDPNRPALPHTDAVRLTFR